MTPLSLWRVGSNPTTVGMSSTSIINDYAPQEMQSLLDSSAGYSDVLRKMGLNPKGGNPRTLKKYIQKFGLDETRLKENRHELFVKCAKNVNSRNTYATEDILNNLHPNYHSSLLLKRLVNEGYKPYRCEICGLTQWNEKYISLQLHHINGDRQDNNLLNLQILCPNCHSQTDNFSGKATSKIKKEQYKKQQKKRQKRNGTMSCPPISRDDLKFKIKKQFVC